jgi:nucleotidyltransferase substrate binding protein (TIGR01987 family)
MLDLSSFEQALGSLDRAAERSLTTPADEEVRDAVIQRFEYSYELAWRMLKRHLEQVVPSPAQVDTWSFRELFREAAERGLVDNVEEWIECRQQRNRTSHAYSANVAASVYATALIFRTTAWKLFHQLKQHNAE